jgi:hypothetical protein
MALSTQPEEYLDTARTFSKEKLHPHPTLEEDVEDFLLGERDGDHAKAHAARRQRLLISSFCVMVVVRGTRGWLPTSCSTRYPCFL